MRRKDRELSLTEAQAVLDRAVVGVLSMCNENGVPYAVPVNFVCDENAIWIHSATEGEKITLLRQNNRVSFCALGTIEVVIEQLTVHYESVIIGGTAHFTEDEALQQKALTLLCEKYGLFDQETINKAIKDNQQPMAVIRLTMETITGKANRV